ncbi:MAG: Ycf66 family protein [Cyanobium sp.]
MLAILGGALALVIGLAVLLLPLLLPELSRARDAVWGAVVLLLGLVLVTSAERLRGAPMLGVLCGGLLIGRLSVEVAQARWRQLSEQEQQRLWSAERWQTALQQFSATAARLPALVSQVSQGLLAWWHECRQPKLSGKRWVRPEPTAEAAATSPEPAPATPASATSEATEPATSPGAGTAEVAAPAAVVASFTELDALITAAHGEGPPEPTGEAG